MIQQFIEQVSSSQKDVKVIPKESSFRQGEDIKKLAKSCRQNQEQERLGQAKNKAVYSGRDQTGTARNRQGCYWEVNPKINVRKSGIEPQSIY